MIWENFSNYTTVSSHLSFFSSLRANTQMKMEKYYKLFSIFLPSVFQSEIRYSLSHISCRKRKENREFSLHSAEKLCPFAQFNTSASALPLTFGVSFPKENIFNFVYLKAAEFMEWRVHRVINKKSERGRRRRWAINSRNIFINNFQFYYSIKFMFEQFQPAIQNVHK